MIINTAMYNSNYFNFILFCFNSDIYYINWDFVFTVVGRHNHWLVSQKIRWTGTSSQKRILKTSNIIVQADFGFEIKYTNADFCLLEILCQSVLKTSSFHSIQSKLSREKIWWVFGYFCLRSVSKICFRSSVQSTLEKCLIQHESGCKENRIRSQVSH